MSEIWRNWTGDQRCRPARRGRPTDEAHVAELVAGAVRKGLTVRTVGSGHSFNDIVSTDGLLLDIAALNRIVEVDATSGHVTVEAGISIHDLGIQLAAHGLAMENLGDIDTQTIAGAISTGTHGTGATLGNISSQVVAMRLITADGESIDISGDGDDLRAARVSLGALGVITRVTLRCAPLFVLERHDESRPLDSVLADFDALCAANDHCEFFAFPHAKSALLKTMNRVDVEPRPAPAWRRWVEDSLLENHAFGAACRVGRRLPRTIPRINRMSARLAGGTHRIDHGYRVFATRRDVRFNEMEYAIPRANVGDAVRSVMDLVKDSRLDINFPIEVRTAAADDAMLSTAHERDTCYVAVHAFQGMEFETYFRGVEAIMNGFEGRPHWGKRHYQSAATLAPLYPQWDAFARVRERLDPGRTFSNAYVRRVLDDAASGSLEGAATQRNAIPSPR